MRAPSASFAITGISRTFWALRSGRHWTASVLAFGKSTPIISSSYPCHQQFCSTTTGWQRNPKTASLAIALSSRARAGSIQQGLLASMSSQKEDGDGKTSASSAGRARTALEEQSDDGEFKRRDSAWRNWISREDGATFQPEADRYHLYVAFACPWAHRTLMTRALKGLEETISITVVHPTWQKTKPDDPDDSHTGWIFGDPGGPSLVNTMGQGGPFPSAFPGNEVDPLMGAKSVREIYEKVGDTDGKYTVPILYDKKLKTIVSNESADIIRMLNSEFNDYAKNAELDLYPQDEQIRKSINEINEWVYPTINNGVYRCGFATKQPAYDKAIDELTNSFDRLEGILSKSRFLTGNAITEADIRLFVTLLRFDEVYVVYFKTNTRTVAGSPILLNYCRDIYQMKGVKETVDMEQIKTHYFTSHPTLNTYSIIPRGPNFKKMLEQPHGRSDMA